MTCKRTKNARKDLAYVVNKFLRAEQLDPNTARSSSDCHTQTVSPDKRHLQVIAEDLKLIYQINLYCAARSVRLVSKFDFFKYYRMTSRRRKRLNTRCHKFYGPYI